MMQDLKTGKLLGASPRLQFKAQLWGIVSGIIFSVPIYMLFTEVWEIGKADGELPAPAAIAWKAVADIMTQGFDALPPMSKEAMLGGVLIGAVLALCKKVPSISNYTPSGMAFGIAFIIPAFYSITMFVGSIILLIWVKKSPTTAEKYIFPVACGAVAGEGMGGVTSALLSLFGL